MAIHVVGGVYYERCVHPRWNQVYGSAGRAALAIAKLGCKSHLHAYMDTETREVINGMTAYFVDFQFTGAEIPLAPTFHYLHDLARPDIIVDPRLSLAPLEVKAENVLRFGMLESDARVTATRAVYDPQNSGDVQSFRANGSTANHLAVVLNLKEARQLAKMPDASEEQVAPVVADSDNAEVVVVKMGALGAFVWTKASAKHVPAYRTDRVWKIGSGDCFAAYFAYAWIELGHEPSDAAVFASQATSYYCETQEFIDTHTMRDRSFHEITASQAYRNGVPRQVYLAAPFFDLGQIAILEQARSLLASMGLRVFSPYHDVGIGTAAVVVPTDLEAIRESDLVFAIADGLDAGTIFEIGYARALNKPTVVYSERHTGGEALKMMEGSGCVLSNSFSTAIYSTLWEAIEL